MLNIHPQYITNQFGEKISVIIPIHEFNNLLEELDDLEDIRLYDEAKADNEISIPIGEAFKIIEAERSTKTE